LTKQDSIEILRFQFVNYKVNFVNLNIFIIGVSESAYEICKTYQLAFIVEILIYVDNFAAKTCKI